MQIERQLAGALGGVYVHQNTVRAGDGADGGQVLDYAGFVVDEHDGGQNRIWPQRCFEDFKIEQAVFLHIKVAYLEAFPLQLATGVQNCLVLRFERDDVLALAGVEVRRALDRQIVRFSRAGGPDDFFWVSIDQASDFLARFFDRRFGAPTERVRTRRRIAEFFDEERNHFFRHARIDWRGRRIVQINRQCQHGSNSVQ